MNEERTASDPRTPSTSGHAPSADRALAWCALAVLLLGVAIQVWLAARSWIGGDQVTLLRLGRDFIATHSLYPVAKSMSGGGSIPGSLLQILIGVPLIFWSDYHAPLVTIGLFDLLAAVLIYRVGVASLGRRFGLILLALYWLSPWRTYHSGFLWEPSFIFLPAALQFFACWKLRDRATFFPSLLLALSIVTALQIHGSFMVLALSTLVLLLRGKIRLHIAGAICGALLGGASLYPTLAAWIGGTLPSSLPSQGFIGYGLVKVFPLFKGLLYWFRLGSLDIGDPLKQTVFLDDTWIAAHPYGRAAAIGVHVLQGLLIVTIILSIWATWWYARRSKRSEPASVPARAWLRSYVMSVVIALVASAALAPFTLQGWHVIVALHAAVIPAALWVEDHRQLVTRRLAWAPVAVLLLQIIVIVTIGLGNDIFRRDHLPHELGERNNLELLRPLLPEALPR
jgi:hypothetical protein